MATEREDWVSPTEAAQMLSVSRDRVVQLCNAGKLRAVKTALGRLIALSSVLHLKEERNAQR